MTGRYAVVWSDGETVRSGRLDVLADGLELRGRDGERAVPFADVTGVGIGRCTVERLRGMPALVLDLQDGTRVRIASLGKPGVLHELAQVVATSGTCAISVVPPPGVDSTASVPSSSASRSRIPTSPSAPSRTSA